MLETIGLRRELYPGQPGTMAAIINLAVSRYQLGRCGEAVELKREVVEIGGGSEGVVGETREFARG